MLRFEKYSHLMGLATNNNQVFVYSKESFLVALHKAAKKSYFMAKICFSSTNILLPQSLYLSRNKRKIKIKILAHRSLEQSIEVQE